MTTKTNQLQQLSLIILIAAIGVGCTSKQPKEKLIIGDVFYVKWGYYGKLQQFQVLKKSDKGVVCKFLTDNAFSGDIEYLELPELMDTYVYDHNALTDSVLVVSK